MTIEFLHPTHFWLPRTGAWIPPKTGSGFTNDAMKGRLRYLAFAP
jgi:hypothetical protein